MRSVRLTLTALALLTALTMALGGIAAAGGPPVNTALAARCDTATGTYVVTLTVDNNSGADHPLIDGEYEAWAGEALIQDGELTFSANPLPGVGTVTATYVVPGTTTYTEVSFGVELGALTFLATAELELDGDCVPTPTTTTTAAPTTTTTRAAAAAEAVQPTFTG